MFTIRPVDHERYLDTFKYELDQIREDERSCWIETIQLFTTQIKQKLTFYLKILKISRDEVDEHEDMFNLTS